MSWSSSKQSHLVCGEAAMPSRRLVDIAGWYESRIRWRW